MVNHVECTDGWEVPDDSFEEVKSNRNRLGPGDRWTRALKWDEFTGQLTEGKLS